MKMRLHSFRFLILFPLTVLSGCSFFSEREEVPRCPDDLPETWIADDNFPYPPEASIVGTWIWECSLDHLDGRIDTPESSDSKITLRFSADGIVTTDFIYDEAPSTHREQAYAFDVGIYDGGVTADTLLFFEDSRHAMGGMRVRCNSEWLQIRTSYEIVDYYYRRFRW